MAAVVTNAQTTKLVRYSGDKKLFLMQHGMASLGPLLGLETLLMLPNSATFFPFSAAWMRRVAC